MYEKGDNIEAYYKAIGKTDLIKGFVSNRTKRPFDAHLTMDFDKGKIGFAFPERAPKVPKAKQ